MNINIINNRFIDNGKWLTKALIVIIIIDDWKWLVKSQIEVIIIYYWKL